MTSHLYNSTIPKFFWFVKRFGIKEVFLKPLRMIFAERIIKNKKPIKFILNKKEYSLFYHKYNITWSNERAVEVPVIIKEVLSEKGEILEIGNVLKHYFKGNWKVVDKYEKGKEIINEDLLSYCPKNKFDLIVSISTFEHFGFDDSGGDSMKKILAALKKATSLLKKNGKFILTVPIGYNPAMDKIIQENKFNFRKQLFLKRASKNKWVETTKEDAFWRKYRLNFPYANAIMIGYC